MKPKQSQLKIRDLGTKQQIKAGATMVEYGLMLARKPS